MSESIVVDLSSSTTPSRLSRRSGRRAASMFATAAMGSWVVLAAMPVVVVILALR